jgi:hypothetical protein
MALLGAAAAVAALHGCVAGTGREDVGIQRLQTRLCEKALECNCEPLYRDDFGQPFECGDWPVDAYEFEYSYRSTLAFDPTCVERWTSWVDRMSCQAPVLPGYADLCPLYHGTRREGEACEQSSLVATDCGAGLLCIAYTCRDPLRTSFGGQGELCELGGGCDDGLTCTPSSICQRLPGPGEYCLEGHLCNAESRCGYDLCVALPGPGERCDSGECQGGAACSFDPVTGVSECERAGEVGEPCQGHRQCASGNCPAGVCEDPAGVGDPCGSQLPCGPGLVCAEAQCQAPGEEGVPSGPACAVLDVL